MRTKQTLGITLSACFFEFHVYSLYSSHGQSIIKINIRIRFEFDRDEIEAIFQILDGKTKGKGYENTNYKWWAA